MNTHNKFITTPISTILEEMVTACHGIKDGMEGLPLKGYMMQSVFLRMTGAQEQKLKCIIWTMADYDYEFRYKLMGNILNFSECSAYKNKSDVYSKMVQRIKKLMHDNDFTFSPEIKQKYIDDISNEVDRIFLESIPLMWYQQDYICYKRIWKTIKKEHFCENKDFLGFPLKEIFEVLYNGRNRHAHNTLSYQDNFPKLNLLGDKDKIYDNYFLWFAVLMLLDKIFIELYNILCVLEKMNQ